MANSCGFFKGHDFSGWEIAQEGDQKTPAGGIIGFCIFQQRKCQTCNYVEIDAQRKTIWESA